MKKTLFIAAAALVSASAFAQTATSANVVGYTKVDVGPGFNLIRVPFVDGTNSVNIQDAMDTSVLTAGAIAGLADKITIWDAANTKYDLYFLSDGTEGKGTNPDKVNKWLDSSNNVADIDLAPGTGFFLSKIGTETVTNLFSGSVVIAETGTNSLTLVEGFNLVASPFTAEWDLNATNSTAIDWIAQGATAGAIAGLADKITVWDAANTKYDLYFLSDGTEGKGTNPDKVGKWLDSEGSVADLTIGLNQGFFYSKLGSGTLTIEVEQPYNLNN